jgi:hypothetical protein
VEKTSMIRIARERTDSPLPVRTTRGVWQGLSSSEKSLQHIVTWVACC